MEIYSENICKLKHEFVKIYLGNSHTTEILPNSPNDFIQIEDKHLTLLHRFLEVNPIYLNKFSENILENKYTIFEGDLNNYWIDSIKHDASYAPFYPTWMLSASCLARNAATLGFEQIIDIGSGDGRIAYCGKILGLDSISIEIDENLVNMQEAIAMKTGVNFNPICSDATIYDFEKISSKKSIFFIGGVPEIGEILAESIIKNALESTHIQNPSFVLTGSHSHRKFSRDATNFGWGASIKKFHLSIISTISLPTYWTMDQKFETPYIFTKKG
jgi:predicted RNA methylase